MKNIVTVGLLTLFLSSCMVSTDCCDIESTTPIPMRTKYVYYPHTYYQPTKVVVVKKKQKYTAPGNHRKNKRHFKVKINKK